MMAGVLEREFKTRMRSLNYLARSIFQPALYLLIFAPLMTLAVGRIEYQGTLVSYLAFALPGIVIMNAFISGGYGGISLYIERISGEFEKLLSLPMERYKLLLGKTTSNLVQTAIQCFIILLLGTVVFGVSVSLAGFGLVLLVASVFTLGWSAAVIALASLLRKGETFQSLMSLISLPMMFGSSAFYPIDRLPLAAKVIAMYNPITQATDLARQMVFQVDLGMLPNVVYLLAFATVAFLAAAYSYARAPL